VTLSGEIIKADGLPVNGMVMDFADVKRIANEFVVERWDHAFLVYRGDTTVMSLLEAIPGHKTVVLDVVPTAENLAAEAFRILDSAYHDVYANHLRLERVRLYETPNCWADATRA
ncbi:MAG: 6-carboxytetrahydropterin synthase, partial [Thauera sp.]|nr:6-carboxytetrahydropterin synthase [Thauera sp.]